MKAKLAKVLNVDESEIHSFRLRGDVYNVLLQDYRKVKVSVELVTGNELANPAPVTTHPTPLVKPTPQPGWVQHEAGNPIAPITLSPDAPKLIELIKDPVLFGKLADKGIGNLYELYTKANILTRADLRQIATALSIPDAMKKNKRPLVGEIKKKLMA